MEQGGGPGPLGDNGGGGQADGHLAAGIEGRVQVVGIMVDVLSDLKQRQRSFRVKYHLPAGVMLQKYCSGR